MKYTMENDNQQQVKSFYRILEEGIAKLPADVRGALYRPCAVDCVKDVVLTELRRQFEECGCDLDRQYTKYGRSEYFFADVIEPGRVYEVGYPRCLCPQVDAGFVDSAAHCECSRQSILYVLEELLPGSVLNRIVVPKKITVHLGKPSANVRNVTVSFQSYIANVASSEVYPTWDSAPGTRRTSI